MAEDDFQKRVLTELAEIKTHQGYFADGLKTIQEHSERIRGAEDSAKSAHHRIDGICATAGLLGSLAGGVVQLISWLMPTKGGH